MLRVGTRARAVLILAAAGLALASLASPAAAVTPQDVTIVSRVTFNPDGPNYGDFTASGPAVAAGLICRRGTFVDTAVHFAGYQSGGDVQLQVDKTFSCRRGTFYVKMQIKADFSTGDETFNWVIQGGTGAYSSLQGSGQGTTVLDPPTGNINTFVGSAH